MASRVIYENFEDVASTADDASAAEGGCGECEACLAAAASAADKAVWVGGWQRDLDVGDCFCIVPHVGVVIYGVVMPPTEEDTPDPSLRRAKTFSAAYPTGADDVLDVKHVDLPITKAQFDVARRLGWPAEPAAWRALLCLGAPAAA